MSRRTMSGAAGRTGRCRAPHDGRCRVVRGTPNPEPRTSSRNPEHEPGTRNPERGTARAAPRHATEPLVEADLQVRLHSTISSPMPDVAPRSLMQRSLAETDPEIAHAIRSET